MIVPDVNLLLYAYDATSRFHAAAAAWWMGAPSLQPATPSLPSSQTVPATDSSSPADPVGVAAKLPGSTPDDQPPVVVPPPTLPAPAIMLV